MRCTALFELLFGMWSIHCTKALSSVERGRQVNIITIPELLPIVDPLPLQLKCFTRGQ